MATWPYTQDSYTGFGGFRLLITTELPKDM